MEKFEQGVSLVEQSLEGLSPDVGERVRQILEELRSVASEAGGAPEAAPEAAATPVAPELGGLQ